MGIAQETSPSMESPNSSQESEMDLELRLALEEASLDAGVNLSAALYPSVLFWLGDSNAVPAFKVRKWLKSARRWTRRSPSLDSGPQTAILNELCQLRLDLSQTESSRDAGSTASPPSTPCKDKALSLRDRLSNAVELDIYSTEFSWEKLISLHHSQHASGSKSAEDDMSKVLEVTVNSGGVVYFAMFKDSSEGEAAAALKFTPSRLGTQSERFGYELAKHMGVACPQSRVIHKGTQEWEQLQTAGEKCLHDAELDEDAAKEATCIELLEAMDLNQCVLLMGYIQGSPFLESQYPFKTQAAVERTAAALGRVYLLDLVIHNEDRLCSSELGWRGNSANLLCSLDPPLGHQLQATPGSGVYMSSTSSCAMASNSKGKLRCPEYRKYNAIRKFHSLQASDTLLCREGMEDENVKDYDFVGKELDVFFLVAIDTGVPRRPPAGIRANDRLKYPKMVELLLNSTDYAAAILCNMSGKKLGFSTPEEALRGVDIDFSPIDQRKVVRAFQTGFRGGIRDMNNVRVFLLKLYRRLDVLLRKFFGKISKAIPEEERKVEMDNVGSRHSPKQGGQGGDSCISQSQPLHSQQETSACVLKGKEKHSINPNVVGDSTSSEQSSLSRNTVKERLSEHALGSSQLGTRLTLKLKGVNKTAKVNPRLNEELKYWNEVLFTEGQRLCQANGFVTGFLEGGGSHSVVDSYELKIRLEHVLERVDLIAQSADTERPSEVLEYLYIGGILAAKSVHTLKHMGITHILCLCPSQFKSAGEDSAQDFQHKEFQVLDLESTDISSIFREACDFIDSCETIGGKTLVHCFEGRSRSAATVLAYLMMRKNLTLSQAWSHLKTIHRRTQPNDGFMCALIRLDNELHGAASMEWQQKKPAIQICPVCGRAAGLSALSLRTHLEKTHPGINITGSKILQG